MTANAAPAHAIRVVDVDKSYAALQVLKRVSVSISEGEVVALLGPSGSGKSTLLRCINHLETLDGGRILVNGSVIGYEDRGDRLMELSDREVSKQRQAIGMVFQSFNLFRHMTVLANVMVGPVDVLRLPKDVARERALRQLASVGLSDKADFYPSQLSGGQQQRVAIARTLAMEPKVLLLDEPTSALDPELSQEVIATIRKLAASGYTMMIATHEMAIAAEFCDRVVFMVDGIVVEDSPAKTFFNNPQHERSRQFLARYETNRL